MPTRIRFLEPGHPIPDPRGAGPEGLVAVGGDLRPATLLDAYGKGVFPWYQEEPILWFSPDPRTVLRPADLRIGRSLRRVLNAGRYEVRIDTAFESVMRACAEAPRPGQHGTWINDDMIRAYVGLHHEGYAHSFEAWREDGLAGGLYGVSLGGAFFGESMFAWRPDASKVAFVRLVEQLRDWDFRMIDCQIRTEHLTRFGATEWPRDLFLRELEVALRRPTRRGRWSPDRKSS